MDWLVNPFLVVSMTGSACHLRSISLSARQVTIQSLPNGGYTHFSRLTLPLGRKVGSLQLAHSWPTYNAKKIRKLGSLPTIETVLGPPHLPCWPRTVIGGVWCSTNHLRGPLVAAILFDVKTSQSSPLLRMETEITWPCQVKSENFRIPNPLHMPTDLAKIGPQWGSLFFCHSLSKKVSAATQHLSEGRHSHNWSYQC